MKTTVPAWNYCSLGGAIRVKIDNGRDLQRLGELDEKYWTVLSCPVADLEFDKETLRLIDSDNDGKIRVGEMVGAARWLCSVIKDKDSIFKGESELGLDNIDRSCGQGQRLYDSARQILHNLGKDSDRISVADASDSIAIFKGTLLNGDGVIIPASCDDPEAAAAVTDCMAAIGSAPDRSGEQGVTADMIEAFYAACADYDAWLAMSEADWDRIFPFGADTAAAYDAVTAVRDKIDDYFTRCRLLAYDKDAAAAVSVPVSAMSDVASCPIAHPRESGLLPLDGINPFWQDAFDSLMKFVSLPKSSKGLDEAGWAGVLARFVPYTQWLGSKKGAQVEGLGAERVRAILKADRKQYLLDLVEKDRALEQESNSIDDVKKLMLLYRDYAKLLNNYLIFSDFYARSDGRRAIFEAGKLYIDQRCCDLCIRVSDMARHADMAKLSGMFLIYCKCTSKLLGKTMDIVAVMTDGDISELRPGKNGVFYDCAGRDWDATVTKVVDNPVSIKQAFWSPYRKFWEFCVGLINKSAADKDAKMMSDMQAKASEAAKSAPAAVTAAGTPAADASRKQCQVGTCGCHCRRHPCCRRLQEAAFRRSEVRRYLCRLGTGPGLYRLVPDQARGRHRGNSLVAAAAGHSGNHADHLRPLVLHRVEQAPQAQPRSRAQCQRLGHQLQGACEHSVRREADERGAVSQTAHSRSERPEALVMVEVADSGAGPRPCRRSGAAHCGNRGSRHSVA